MGTTRRAHDQTQKKNNNSSSKSLPKPKAVPRNKVVFGPNPSVEEMMREMASWYDVHIPGDADINVITELVSNKMAEVVNETADEMEKAGGDGKRSAARARAVAKELKKNPFKNGPYKGA